MKKLSYAYISALCVELHLIVKAGIPIGEGVKLLADGERNKEISSVLDKIASNMETGEEFPDALRNTGSFPEYLCEMVEIGVKTGYQEEVLKSLSEYYESQDQLNRSIRNAIAYPSVLLVMLLFVAAILVTQVLPIFSDVYSQLGSEMPALAASIMRAGAWLSSYRVLVLILLAAVAAAGVFLVKAPNARKKLFASGRKPESLSGKIATARLSLAMSMTMQSGLDTGESLAMAKRLTENVYAIKRIDACRQLVDAGKPFASAAGESDLFPPTYSRMLEIGVRTGTADAAMAEIARRSELAATAEIDRVIGLIEPTLVIVMSVFIGAILLAVMLPLTGIMSAL
ncbi:MAG: type II secretion system F family protein [Oscillospiraceae bacterium]|nr:type II secretion system F family protein [Oscillospiraceae bacterium]